MVTASSLPTTSPASICVNDGLAILSSSLMLKNCEGANGACSIVTCVRSILLSAAAMAKRFAHGAPPKTSMSRPVSSGTTSCLTASRPSGSSTSAVPGASLRSATPWLWLAGACVLQLCAVESARLSSASTSTAGGGGGGSPLFCNVTATTE